MSYAGTYEPCPHDSYARNCRECLWENGGRERFLSERPHRLAHPDDAAGIVIESEQITVFSAKCPNPLCLWNQRQVGSADELQRAIESHVKDCERVAAEWSKGWVATLAREFGEGT